MATLTGENGFSSPTYHVGTEQDDEPWNKRERPSRGRIRNPPVMQRAAKGGKKDSEVDKEHKKRTCNTTIVDNSYLDVEGINICSAPALFNVFLSSARLDSNIYFEKQTLQNHTPVIADVSDDSKQLSTEIEYHPFDLKVTGFPQTAQTEVVQCPAKKQPPQSEKKGDDSLHSDALIHVSFLQKDNIVVHEKESTRYVSSETKSACFNDEQTKLESSDPFKEDRTEQTILTGVNLSEKIVLPTEKLRDSRCVYPMKKSFPENKTPLACRLHTDSLPRSSVSLQIKHPQGGISTRTAPLSQAQNHEPVLQEFDKLRCLQASVAQKRDGEFPADLGKSQALLSIQAAAVEVLVASRQMIKPHEQKYWEIWRLGTFSEVDDLVVFAIRLAQNGFYYDNSQDVITCFSCHLKKRHWDRSEKPAITHLLLSRECKHANCGDERNVPVTPNYPLLSSSGKSPRCGDHSEEIMQDGESSAPPSLQASTEQSPAPGLDTTRTPEPATLPASDGSHPDAGSRAPDQESTGTTEIPQRSSTTSSIRSGSDATLPQAPQPDSVSAQNTGNLPCQQNPGSVSWAVAGGGGGPQSSESEQDSDSGYAWTQSALDMRCAASPSNAAASVRFKSFLNWPESRVPSSKDLVLAGFYYLGVGDNCRCFYCGITLRQWQPGDDPWKVHVQFRFSCDYVRAIKGEDFVRDTLVQTAISRQGSSTASEDESSSAGVRIAETPFPDDANPGTASTAPLQSSSPTTTAPTITTTTPPSAPTPASDTTPPSSGRNQVSSDPPRNAPDPPSQREGVGRSFGAHDSSNTETLVSGPALGKHSGAGGTDILTAERKDGPGSGFAGDAFRAATQVGGVGVQQSQSIVVAHAQEFSDAGNRYGGQRSSTGDGTGNQDGGQRSSTGDSTGNQLAEDGIGTNTQTNEENTTNQDRVNGRGTNRNRRVSSTNRRRTNTQPPSTQNSSNSHSDSLQSDSEPPGTPQTATPSTTSSTRTTTTTRNVPRGPATLASSTTAGREGGSARSSRGSRVTNADSASDQRAYLQQLEETNQRLRQGRSCRLCGVQAVDTIFMPCGHLCTCGSCAATIRSCCLCNRPIRATAHVFLE